MDKNMEIISQFMATITQTNEWFRICNENPQIQRASQGLQITMARVSALVPEAIMCELWDSILLAFAYGRAKGWQAAKEGAA